MRHRKLYNAVRAGVPYSVSDDIGVKIKTLHRFAAEKLVYRLDIHPTSKPPDVCNIMRVTGVVLACGGQTVNDYYTTVSPHFYLSGVQSLTDPLQVVPEIRGFSIFQTRGEVSGDKQEISIAGYFSDEPRDLHPWTVRRIEAVVAIK